MGFPTPRLIQLLSVASPALSIIRNAGGLLGIPSPANCFQDSAGTTPCAVDDPIGYLKDLVGTNHMTQATAGFKPILRGKVKNWLINTATLATQSIAVATSGVTWTLSFKGTGTVTLSGGYAGSLVGIGVNDRVSLTFETTAATNVTYTVTGSVTEAQSELGSVANPYVESNATPKSSSYGPYWMDFDGVDDRLELSDLTFFRDKPFGYIAASCTNYKSSSSYVLGITTNSGATRLGIATISYAPTYLARRLDADSATIKTFSGKNFIHGVIGVAASWYLGSITGRFNSASGLSGTFSTSGNTSDTSSASIQIGNLNSSSPLLGGVWGVCLLNQEINEAQQMVIERHLAKETGVSS